MTIFIIALFGPDGAGKTTLALGLAKILKSKGYTIVYAKMRSHHTLMYLLMKIVLRLKLSRVDINEIYRRPHLNAILLSKYIKQKRAYVFLELIGVMFHILMTRVKVSLLRLLMTNARIVIIYDRFMPDFVANISLTFNVDVRFMNTVLSITERALPYKKMLVYVDAKNEEIVRRKRDEKFPLSYINLIRHRYNLIFVLLKKATKVDTTSKTPVQSIKILLKTFEQSI